ncbi:interferon-induced transmembrane protein [Plakobranchus ocellatus]|uniref:Interferon-induced transmembrane protein n=1 Tax=Plakobranchus ocellatus TaxID=259542 RepID=A0AAV4E232_9GAST|nr:interferon-induced transmembrane protein [Plakobranchus ocellatus]
MEMENRAAQPEPGYSQPPGYPPTDGYPQPGAYSPPNAYPQSSGYPQPPGYEPTSEHNKQQATSNITIVHAPVASEPEQHVDDNMIISIVSLFCCCIIGIFAIIKAQESKESLRRREYSKAREASQTAKKLAIAAIVLGVIGISLGIFLGVILPLILVSSVAASY